MLKKIHRAIAVFIFTTFSWDACMLALGFWIGLDDIQAGILVLILWQLVKLNDKKGESNDC